MSLTDIVAEAIAATERGSTINTHEAVEHAFPVVREDEEATDQCIREALGKRIKDVATRRDRKPPHGDDDDLLLFDLRERHALDLEGRTIKKTLAMSQMEFARVREIRRQSIVADEAYLKQLDEAAAALAPIWALQPHLTFGEAQDIYLSRRGAA